MLWFASEHAAAARKERKMTGNSKSKKSTTKIKKRGKEGRDLLGHVAAKITGASCLSIREEDLDTLDDMTLEAIDKAMTHIHPRVKHALGTLADAADAYMTSDPQMPSHNETERDLEQAIDAARQMLIVSEASES